MRKLRVLVAFDSAGPPPEDQDFSKEFEQEDWFTEAAVVETLQLMGHNVRTLGLYDDISLLIRAIEEFKPHVVFNLIELFNNKAHLDQTIPALLDLLGVPYTGCGPGAMVICNNKALSKKILSYHRIRVPKFHAFRKGNKVWVPARFPFPAVVKPLQEEASTGISQASYVLNGEQMIDRVRFVHETLRMHAIVEEYIDGRELYVSLMGHTRLQAFPIREMRFANVSNGDARMATYKAKWDEEYRKRRGISNGYADLPAAISTRIMNTCKRAYRALGVDGYARFDCRLTESGRLYILEANANPELAQGDEFAESAAKAGLTYDRLLQQLLNGALRR
jgi:D-alanine-D-alanine ligase